MTEMGSCFQAPPHLETYPLTATLNRQFNSLVPQMHRAMRCTSNAVRCTSVDPSPAD
jgi:hypothetical protein